jgi:hypothetical protein
VWQPGYRVWCHVKTVGSDTGSGARQEAYAPGSARLAGPVAVQNCLTKPERTASSVIRPCWKRGTSGRHGSDGERLS